jgi:hypothetical protein
MLLHAARFSSAKQFSFLAAKAVTQTILHSHSIVSFVGGHITISFIYHACISTFPSSLKGLARVS